MRPDEPDLAAAERERHGGFGRFRRVSPPLEHGHDTVGHFNHSVLVGRPLEPDGPDNRTALLMDDGEAMHPRVCRL